MNSRSEGSGMQWDVGRHLHAAAASVYRGCQPKLLLAQSLIIQMTAANGHNAGANSNTAAAMLGMTVQDMLDLLRRDPCFRVYQASDPVAGTVIMVTLDSSALLAAAKRQHVPPVVGYVQGLYPIRPGAMSCPFYVKHGRCDFQRNCVYNHPGPEDARMHAVPPPPPPPPPPQQAAYAGQLTWQQQHMQLQQQQYQPPPPVPYQYHPTYASDPNMQAGQHDRARAAGSLPGSSSGMGTPASLHPYGPLDGPLGTNSSQLQYPHQQQNHQNQQQQPWSHALSEQQLLQQQVPAGHHAAPAAVTSGEAAAAGTAGSAQHLGQQHSTEQQRASTFENNQQHEPAAANTGGGSGLLDVLQSKLRTSHDITGNSRSIGHPSSSSSIGHPSSSEQQDPGQQGSAIQMNWSSSSRSMFGAQGSRNTANNSSTVSSAAPGGSSSGVGEASKQVAAAQVPVGRVVDPQGVFLQGVPSATTQEELRALLAACGVVVAVTFNSARQNTKCAFVDFDTVEAAQQVNPTQQQQQSPAQGSLHQGSAGVSASSPSAAASSGYKLNDVMGKNELGLPQRRGSPACPFFMGTGWCRFGSGCKYHHPRHALHPECVAEGKMPVRYNTKLLPSYARLVNFTERLWDYDSCVEAQLKIWLARHILASENTGCGMFDESAAVPAAPDTVYDSDPNQPLGPYSCTMEEAEQVLQLLWKAQPDESAKQAMPYRGAVRDLLWGDPYYDLATDPRSNSHWVRLSVSKMKEMLNF